MMDEMKLTGVSMRVIGVTTGEGSKSQISVRVAPEQIRRDEGWMQVVGGAMQVEIVLLKGRKPVRVLFSSRLGKEYEWNGAMETCSPCLFFCLLYGPVKLNICDIINIPCERLKS